jgi:hypothetical protein
MKRLLLFFVLLVMLLSLWTTIIEACAIVSITTGWQYIDPTTLLLLRGGTAIALLKTLCIVMPTSQISLLGKDILCLGDKILVDGNTCDLMKVEQL